MPRCNCSAATYGSRHFHVLPLLFSLYIVWIHSGSSEVGFDGAWLDFEYGAEISKESSDHRLGDEDWICLGGENTAVRQTFQASIQIQQCDMRRSLSAYAIAILQPLDCKRLSLWVVFEKQSGFGMYILAGSDLHRYVAVLY